MKLFYFIAFSFLVTSCWPSSVSFMDKGSMPPEWKTFTLKTLDNSAPNTPLSYPAQLSEAVKDGIQNNTRLLITSKVEESNIDIEGVINSYSITPIALQNDDSGSQSAAQNRLTISVNFDIYIKEPEPDEMKMTSTRFIDYSSSQDIGSVETQLLEEINTQIVQDVINKLLSNW
ncbi:MAG: LPS assembly lipoprotein LptE [Crocinitomicaceae bacterium]